LEAINAHADLREHFELIGEAMNVIYAFSHDHAHGSDNELTLQMLGIRLFNAAGASVKLALSGYYQKAFDQVRDILETYFLVDYLTTKIQRRSGSGRLRIKECALRTSAPVSSATSSISATAIKAVRARRFTTLYPNTPLTHRTRASASLRMRRTSDKSVRSLMTTSSPRGFRN
jgi:hypothetical protein